MNGASHRGREVNRLSPTPGTSSGFQTHESTAAGAMGAVKDKAKEFASEVAGKAGEAWDSTRQGAQQWAAAVADQAEGAWKGFNSIVRRYPFPSLLVAFGLGFVLAEAMQCMTHPHNGRGL